MLKFNDSSAAFPLPSTLIHMCERETEKERALESSCFNTRRDVLNVGTCTLLLIPHDSLASTLSTKNRIVTGLLSTLILCHILLSPKTKRKIKPSGILLHTVHHVPFHTRSQTTQAPPIFVRKCGIFVVVVFIPTKDDYRGRD
jgi:hypothetical protein